MNLDRMHLIFPGRSAITIKEFLAAVPIGPTLFHRLQKEGQIQTFKVGSRTLIPISVANECVNAAPALKGAQGDAE